jgi:hypothetical protein
MMWMIEPFILAAKSRKKCSACNMHRELVQFQMLVLVMSSGYLNSRQSLQLLSTFCPSISEKETNRAGTLLHMAAVDPLDYWQDVLPVLESSVQSETYELARIAGRLDIANPTNRHAATFPKPKSCCDQLECMKTAFEVKTIVAGRQTVAGVENLSRCLCCDQIYRLIQTKSNNLGFRAGIHLSAHA